MHARIYELSPEPLMEDEFITEETFCDHWFCNQIADYVNGDIIYENEKFYFFDKLKSSNAVFIHNDEPAAVRFMNRFKQIYFKHRFERFKKELTEMDTVSLDAFIGSDLDMNMYRLESAFDNKYDDYIYLCGELMTFDSFVRYLEPGKQYFLGGILDYHF